MVEKYNNPDIIIFSPLYIEKKILVAEVFLTLHSLVLQKFLGFEVVIPPFDNRQRLAGSNPSHCNPVHIPLRHETCRHHEFWKLAFDRRTIEVKNVLDQCCTAQRGYIDERNSLSFGRK